MTEIKGMPFCLAGFFGEGVDGWGGMVVMDGWCELIVRRVKNQIYLVDLCSLSMCVDPAYYY